MSAETGAEAQPVSEQEESLVGDWETFQKLQQENERVDDQCNKYKVVEKFLSKLEKQATTHFQALKASCDSSKALADTFREFYHFANCDALMTEVTDDLCIQTGTTTQELPRSMEKEFEMHIKPYIQHWEKEIARVKDLHKQREAARKKFTHYINKLQSLGEKPKKGVVLSEKKQTQVKRNRLKLDEARKNYEKTTMSVWSSFDVCWDCQFTQLNPMFAEWINLELKSSAARQQSVAIVEETLGDKLRGSWLMNSASVNSHSKAAGRDDKGDERNPRMFSPAQAAVQEMSAVKIEYNLNDMLATVLDSDITDVVRNIPVEQLCNQMPIVGAVLAKFPRQATSQALMQRAAKSPPVAQCVGFLKECDIVRPHELLSDIVTNMDLVEFFLAFEKVITGKDNVAGLDFKMPANAFHPFEVERPLRRFVVQYTFLSNAKPVLLAAFSEYEENERFTNEGKRDEEDRRPRGSNPPTPVASPPSPVAVPPSPPASASFASAEPRIPPRPGVASTDEPPIPPRPGCSGDEPPIPPRPGLKVPVRPKFSKKMESLELPSSPAEPVPKRVSLTPTPEERAGTPKAPEGRWELLDQRHRLPDFIFKAGDDLRTDQACLHLFRLMNHLWKSQKLVHKQILVQAKVYKVQAITSRIGLVEYVPGCYPLSALTKQAAYGMTEQKIDRIVATSVSGYIAAYILGIKDRHSDNILIMEDATVFHIDFGHVLGRGVTIDTGPFAITPELKALLEQWYSWHSFVEMCEKAFLVMRTHAGVVAEFAHLVLSPMFPDIDVSAFVMEKLMVDLRVEEATSRLRKMVTSAPYNYKTRLKNLVHGANTSIAKARSELKMSKPAATPNKEEKQDDAGELLYEGRLLKKSPKGINRYQDRTFQLFPTMLRYRNKQGVIKGEILLCNIEGARISERPDSKQCEFEIDVKNISKEGVQGLRRTFAMRASSPEEAKVWLKAILDRVEVVVAELASQGLDLSGRSY